MYVFRTRLPVASLYIAIKLLPLDLHVLSLPLAFILSQDSPKKFGLIPHNIIGWHHLIIKTAVVEDGHASY